MPGQNRNDDVNTDESSDESFDSDQIDSEIEAELYSTIHHEVVSTEHKDNPDIEHNSSINLISVEENRIFEEKESLLSPSNKCNMYLGFSFAKGKSNDEQIVGDADTSLKRKSNLIANILDDIQVETESPNKKQKTVKSVNRTKCSASSSRNVTIEISDSDTDSSVILSEPDESSVRKLQTNIETYIVNSDSDSSFTWPGENDVNFDLNLSRNNNFDGNYKDVWEINGTDLYRTKGRSAGRYHENAVSNCTNCNKKGHVARNCSEPKTLKCVLCGGVHWHSHCNHKICLKCFRFGHATNRCYFPIDDILCSICNMRGHGKKCCPDLWRRYHLTTSGSHIVKGQIQHQTTPVYCCNCGLEGHYGIQCTKSRMDRWSYPTLLSVVSYEQPEGFAEGFQRNMNVRGNNPITQQPIPPNRPKYQIAPGVNPKDRKKFLRNLRNRQKKLRKVLNKAQNNSPGVNPSSFSNRNFGRRNVLVKQEVDFPRTPKVSQPPCVDEMPKMKHTRRGPKLNRKRRKEMMRKNHT